MRRDDDVAELEERVIGVARLIVESIEPKAAQSARGKSLAQGVAVEVPGVGVRIGEPPRRERARREEWQEREVRSGPNCRTVTVTEDTPTGTRTRSKRECD